ncbi:hypothetical protein MMC21_005992 [Puttea exsequens]|nr:hypothetical protein [Puttea exsequens]
MPLTLPSLPSWSATKTTSKQGFDKVYNLVDKLGPPVNKLSNKLGSEAFWPTTLDKESDKAARILRSFCKDGFYFNEGEEEGAVGGVGRKGDGLPKGKQRVVKKIPQKVIQKAKGLAIFTTMRTGLWVSGAGGSGVLVARKEDGSWSSPSGIMLHTAGLGFLVGVDIYDCVVVINTAKALEAFTKIRCTLGGEVSAVAGPVGMGGILETEMHKRQAPVWNYLKSRGFYAGVQIDGTVIIERGDENERFYGERLSVADILTGKVRHVPYETRTLMATIKAAQGDIVDESLLPASEPTPGDFEVADDQGHGFGLPPAEDDPDPYGVKALEQQGMEIKEIKESGAVSRPSGDAFDYKPSPSSPVFANFRHSRGHQKRDSGALSIASTDRGTQTGGAEGTLDSPRFTESPQEERNHSPAIKTSQNLAEDVDDGDPAHKHQEHAEEMPIISKAKLVSIPKRIPPPLPPRNPNRSSAQDITSFEVPQSPPLEEHKDQDVDINVIRPSGDQGRADEDNQLHLTQSQDDALENKLHDVHLGPHEDAERLSPMKEKDGFDDVSLSESNYSHGTPAEPMEDIKSAEPAIQMEDREAAPNLSLVTGKENETPQGKHEDDEFHSVPGTPEAPEQHYTDQKRDSEGVNT